MDMHLMKMTTSSWSNSRIANLGLNPVTVRAMASRRGDICAGSTNYRSNRTDKSVEQ